SSASTVPEGQSAWNTYYRNIISRPPIHSSVSCSMGIPHTDQDSETGPPRLRGHIARQNSQFKAIIDAVKTNSATLHVLASLWIPLRHPLMSLLQGSVYDYVTAKFYSETKPASEKVVPTSNHLAVRARPRQAPSLHNKFADLYEMYELSIMGWTFTASTYDYYRRISSG
ncbi:hypothetical protein D6D06_10215, partial [Aureobasidium pullulans]